MFCKNTAKKACLPAYHVFMLLYNVSYPMKTSFPVQTIQAVAAINRTLIRTLIRPWISFAMLALLVCGLLNPFAAHAWKSPFQSHASHYPHQKNSASDANTAVVADTDIAHIALSQLPKEAHTTLRLIQSNGVFPYKDKDGSIYSNREQTLPKQKRGYYTEYTVKTPYARNRGARRIIAGQGTSGDPSTSGEYFYTADHYATFQRIDLDQ